MPTSPFTLNVGGSTVDTIAKAVNLKSLQLSARATDRFEFVEHVKHYGATWHENQVVELQFPTGSVRFTGKIMETYAEGDESEHVRYVCVGWRALAQHVDVQRFGPDEAAPNTFPERIYNAPDDDPDKIYRALGPSATVGAILTNLFDSFLTSLRNEGACHPSTTPYVAGDLSVLTFVPGKLVLNGMNFEQAVVAVLREQGPAWSFWVDTTGVWRFYDTRTVATSSTVTIGSDVKRSRLNRSLRGKYTAVKVVGRRGRGKEILPGVVGMGVDEYATLLSGVTPLWNGFDELQWTLKKGEGIREQGIVSSVIAPDFFTITGRTWASNQFINGFAIFPRLSYVQRFNIIGNTADTFQIAAPGITSGSQAGNPVILFGPTKYSDVYRLFQITDPTKRDVLVESLGGMDCCPQVVAVLRDEDGNVVGTQYVNIRLEGDGKFRTEWPLFKSASNGREIGDSITHPDWKLVFCYQNSNDSNITVRFPSTLFSGLAAAAPYNVERELTVAVDEFQDQSLSVLAAFGTLATEIHKITSTVGASGEVVLQDLDWTYLDPRRRISIAHTGVETTGLESLQASMAGATFDFLTGLTSIQVSDDGSNESIDFQGMLEQIRGRMRAASVAIEAQKMTEFINCRGKERAGPSRNDRVSEGANEPLMDFRDLPAPTYNESKGAASKDERNSRGECKCEKHVDSCNKPWAPGQAFECKPDAQIGLIARRKPFGGRCLKNQLVDGESGMYYPFVCAGKDIRNYTSTRGNVDDDKSFNPCTSMRRLVVIEPASLDDDGSGDEIGIADMLIQFLRAYDAYMQHNEEAHCCLDNRLACVDAGVWNINGSSTECYNGECKNSVQDQMIVIQQLIDALEVCINKGKGEFEKCDVGRIPMNTNGCGPC